jgi:hypothetical protein
VVFAKNTGWDYTSGSVRLIDESLDNTDAARGGGLAAAMYYFQSHVLFLKPAKNQYTALYTELRHLSYFARI